MARPYLAILDIQNRMNRARSANVSSTIAASHLKQRSADAMQGHDMERSNVVAFPRAKARLDSYERETIETILYFFTQCEVSWRECELTTKPMERIRAEQEAPELRSHAFVYPVSRWPVEASNDQIIGHQIVIDLGKQRAFFYHSL